MVSNMLRRPVEKLRTKTAVARPTDANSSQQPREHHAKPFAKVSFYLDLKDYVCLKKLTEDIKSLGGTVETFLSKDVKYVVTNRANWKQQLRNGPLDDGSLPSTPNSFSNTKSGVTNDSPCNLESPKERSVPKIVTSRAGAILERALQSATKGSSDVLQIARLWGVKVVPLTAFVCILKKSKGQQVHQRPHNTKDISKMKSNSTSVKKTKLVHPFLKFEDNNREYRPQYRQFRDWPVLNLNTSHTRSPFARPSYKKSVQKGGDLRHKRVSSSLANQENSLQNKPCIDKRESFRLIKTADIVVTQPLKSSTCTENNKIDVVTKPGFCEMCLIRYDDIYAHIEAKEHQQHLQKPGFYTALDKKIASLPDIYTFTRMAFQTSNSRSSDLTAMNKKLNAKENFSMPMLQPAYRKRKQQADSSQSLRKKRKALAVSGTNNTENCGNSNHITVNSCNESPLKVRNTENVDMIRQTSNLKDPLLCKRKALQGLNLNVVKPINFGTGQSQDLLKCRPEIPLHLNEKTECEEKPKAIRVLRSTAMRRISASQSTASSPIFRSAVLGDLLDSRRTNSSPCRSLDLGAPSSGCKRQPFLAATNKLKNLAAEYLDDVRSDMQCLESVFDRSLSDMSSLKCVTPISPLEPDTPPQSVPVTPTGESEGEQARQKGDDPQTPHCTDILQEPMDNACPITPSASAAGAVEFSDISVTPDNVEPQQCLPSTYKADDNYAPALDDNVSEAQQKTKCVEDCLRTAHMLGVSTCNEPNCAIKEVENESDPSSKKEGFASPAESQNPAQGSLKVIGSEDNDSAVLSTNTSSSSVFNLVSSPIVHQCSKTSTSTDSAVHLPSEGIPKFVFKRIKGDKRSQWTLSILSDGTSTANRLVS